MDNNSRKRVSVTPDVVESASTFDPVLYQELRQRYLEPSRETDAELPHGGMRLRQKTRAAQIDSTTPGFRALKKQIQTLKGNDKEIFEILNKLRQWEIRPNAINPFPRGPSADGDEVKVYERIDLTEMDDNEIIDVDSFIFEELVVEAAEPGVEPNEALSRAKKIKVEPNLPNKDQQKENELDGTEDNQEEDEEESDPADSEEESTGEILYQPLISSKETRWRASEILGGAHKLAGTWKVYASYHFIAFWEFEKPIDSYRRNYSLVMPTTGTLQLNIPESTEPRDVSHKGSDGGCKETAKKVVPLLAGSLTLNEYSAGSFVLNDCSGDMPVTVLPPNSFRKYSQRVVLGGLVDAQGDRVDGDAVFDSVVEGNGGYHWLDYGHMAAAVDVNGRDSCSLECIDISKLDEHTIDQVKDDDKALLFASADPLTVRKGDLRLTVRWNQRGGHDCAGMGVAYLCQRIGNPPAISAPCPLPFASEGELFECLQSNLDSDNF